MNNKTKLENAMAHLKADWPTEDEMPSSVYEAFVLIQEVAGDL